MGKIPELKLVLTDCKFRSGRFVARWIHGLGDPFGNQVPLEIRCLNWAACATVYLPLFEGFGAPVAEAILAGTLVVCPDFAPLREIWGRYGRDFRSEQSGCDCFGYFERNWRFEDGSVST